MLKQILATLALASGLAAHAAPAQFNFSYEFSGGKVLSGSLWGELQGDNNLIHVSSFNNFVKIDGVNGPAILYVESYREFAGNPSGFVGNATLSVNGAVMDIIACSANPCDLATDEGFLFESDGSFAGSASEYNSSADFSPTSGFFSETFDPDNWIIRQVQAPNPNGIPEPGSLALLGLGLVGLAAMRKSRS